MDQNSGTTNPDPAAQSLDDSQPAETPPPAEQPGFRSRGQARRRARFLRRARELAYRDLGGLVFNLHRFGQRNDPLVLAKLSTVGHIDTELRTIEAALHERRPVTVLREAGITACPRCAAIHGSEDRFCPNCGLPMNRHADLPIAGAPAPDPEPASRTPPNPAPQPVAAASQAAASPPQPHEGAAPVPAAPAPGQSTPAPDSAPSTAPASGPPLAMPGGRSPLPPATRIIPQADPVRGGGNAAGPEESTEILHPRAPGS